MITCKPGIPNEYVWMIWNLPGHGARHKEQQMSIEEWFYIMELEKEDPDGHLFPIDKNDPMWSGDFGAWREQQGKAKLEELETVPVEETPLLS